MPQHRTEKIWTHSELIKLQLQAKHTHSKCCTHKQTQVLAQTAPCSVNHSAKWTRKQWELAIIKANQLNCLLKLDRFCQEHTTACAPKVNHRRLICLIKSLHINSAHRFIELFDYFIPELKSSSALSFLFIIFFYFAPFSIENSVCFKWKYSTAYD